MATNIYEDSDTFEASDATDTIDAVNTLAFQQWDTHPEAEISLFDACLQAGFAAARQRSANRDLKGEYTRYVYACYKGGNVKPSTIGETGGTRNVSTAKTNCPWGCALSRSKYGGLWRFSFVSQRSTHNHELSENARDIALNRRRALYQPEILEAIISFSFNKRNSYADIVDVLKRDFLQLEVYERDISNIIAKQRKEYFGDRILIQQFLEYLATEDGIWHSLLRSSDDRINAIFWTYK